MPIYIVEWFRMLLEWADGLLSKMLECMDGMYTPWTVMTTRAPAMLEI